jgi:hypothetical protein
MPNAFATFPSKTTTVKATNEHGQSRQAAPIHIYRAPMATLPIVLVTPPNCAQNHFSVNAVSWHCNIPGLIAASCQQNIYFWRIE